MDTEAEHERITEAIAAHSSWWNSGPTLHQLAVTTGLHVATLAQHLHELRRRGKVQTNLGCWEVV